MKKIKLITGICTSLLMGVVVLVSNPVKAYANINTKYMAVVDEAKDNAKDNILGEKMSGFSWVEREDKDHPKRHWFDAKQLQPGYQSSISYGKCFNVTDPSSEYFCLPDHAFKWIESQPDSENYSICLIASANQYDKNGFLTKQNSVTYLVDYTMELCIIKSDKPVPSDKKYITNCQSGQCVQRFIYSFKVQGQES